MPESPARSDADSAVPHGFSWGGSRWPSLRAQLTLRFGVISLVSSVALALLTYGLFARTPLLATGTSTSVGVPGQPLPPLRDLAARAELQRAADLHRLGVILVVAVVVTVLATVVVAWVVAGRATGRLVGLARGAEGITAYTLGERLRDDGPDDEVGRLTQAFNALLQRVDVALAGQELFVAHASHELRTPLTLLRARLEEVLAARDPSSEEWRAAAEAAVAAERDVEGLLAALLLLARSDARPGDEPVDLASVCRAALSRNAARAAERGIEITSDLGDVQVPGHAQLLLSAVDNLVTNAIAHNVRGGRAEVRLSGDDHTVVLRVDNDGPVVADDVERLFRPFERGTGGRGHGEGHGLGLAIVRTVALAHGGSVDAAPRHGGGLSVWVRLPLAARVGS